MWWKTHQLLSVWQLSCYYFSFYMRWSFKWSVDIYFTNFDFVLFFYYRVSFSNKVVAKAASKNSYNDQNGKWLNNFPLSALPITPKLIMKFVPLPFSCEGNSSGIYTPNTIIMAVSTSLMNPSTTVCIHTWVENINPNNKTISDNISILKTNLLLIVCNIFVNKTLANISVHPTTMVLISKETPKLSSVNCVR